MDRPFRRRDIFLKIEPVPAYSPLSPVPGARGYGRDCFYNSGHEAGRIPGPEIFLASLDALTYREYLDPHCRVPATHPLVRADANEPPWSRRIPGAVLYASPGERLYIHVLNGDPVETHSFHLHGLHYGIDADGTWPFGIRARDGRRSDAIRPGEKWIYVFDATAETTGAWSFHDHAGDVARSVNRGLFGGLIVRDPSWTPVDEEVPLFVHLMEGTTQEEHIESPSLAPTETFSYRFGQSPATRQYYCRIHGVSMSGTVTVVPGGPPHVEVGMQRDQFVPAAVTVGPGGTVVWTNREDPTQHHHHIVYFSGSGAPTFCLNGRAFVGNTPTVVVETGRRLRWYLFNLDLGEQWHNFHPHGLRWRVPGAAGPTDVRALSPTETAIVETEAPLAVRLPRALADAQEELCEAACRVRVKGDFLFHCHIEHHMMRGLAGLVRAWQHLWITPELDARLPFELPYDDGTNDGPPLDLAAALPAPMPPHGGHGSGDGPTAPVAEAPHPDPTSPTADQPDSAPAAGEAAPRPAVSEPATVSDHEMPSMPMSPATPGGGHDHGHTASGDGNAVRDAATRGWWELLSWESPVLAVHAALLHTGKVLLFAGSGQDADKHNAHDFRSAIWDYERGRFRRVRTPADFFCAGQTFLPDGRLLVAGGTRRYLSDDPWYLGLRRAYLFDPRLEEWLRLPDMADGRWYPSLLTLADGRILAMAGYREAEDPENPRAIPMNRVPEIYTDGEAWSALPPSPRDWPTYPHLFLLADGTVFFSGGTMGDNAGVSPCVFHPMTNAVLKEVPGLQDANLRDQSASVLLPPAQDQRVMIMGGGFGDETSHTPSSNKVDIADFKEASPRYRPAAPLHFIRMHLNAVLLPDRTVCVCGGGRSAEHDPALEAEIYNPATNRWTLGARATVPRLYHSVALLLPDGRVLTAGSNPHPKDDEMRLEIFHPPYLFRGPRPFIQSAPAFGCYGETIDIETPQAGRIVWVDLIRPAATTHSFDTAQRLVALPFHRDSICQVHARLPSDPNLAPPGWYMLFIVDDQRIPSVARWIHLQPRANPLEPDRSLASI